MVENTIFEEYEKRYTLMTRQNYRFIYEEIIRLEYEQEKNKEKESDINIVSSLEKRTEYADGCYIKIEKKKDSFVKWKRELITFCGYIFDMSKDDLGCHLKGQTAEELERNLVKRLYIISPMAIIKFFGCTFLPKK
jgi:hypothetical protein